MANWILFQELRDHVSMEDILRHYGLMEKFRRNRDEVVGLCPFHEETTASFHVSLTKNVFHCFGCQSKCQGRREIVPAGRRETVPLNAAVCASKSRGV